MKPGRRSCALIFRAKLETGEIRESAIVPGSAEKSELIARVTAADPDDRMPPLKTGKKLTPAQIESLRKWIDRGCAATPRIGPM